MRLQTVEETVANVQSDVLKIIPSATTEIASNVLQPTGNASVTSYHHFRSITINHMKCQCQVLHIHWSQHVTNAEVSARTGLPPVMDSIRRRRLSVFGHIALGLQHTSPTLPRRPSIQSFTWWQLETSSSRSLDRPTPQRHWICSCQPLETDRPWWSDSTAPSWLHDDDDDY